MTEDIRQMHGIGWIRDLSQLRLPELDCQKLLTEEAQVAMARHGARPMTASAAAMQAWRETVGAEQADLQDTALAAVYDNSEDGLPGPFMTELPSIVDGTVDIDRSLSGLEARLNQ